MKTLAYILAATWLFAWLDWQSIHQTRWVHREWLEWMHTHEGVYAGITRPLETVLCTPCMALKPIGLEAFKRVNASQEEQDAITHALPMDLHGFYTLHSRATSWTFVPWAAWFLYWTPPSVVWFWVARKIIK